MFMGIDLAWSPKNLSGIAVLDKDNIIHLRVVHTLAEVQDLVRKYQPHVIAVDAPLTVNNARGNREAEKSLNQAFRKYDAGCYPANRMLLGKYNNGVPRGEELKKLLGYDENAMEKGIIEVYPHAAQIRYFKREKILKYKKDPVLLSDYARLLKTKVNFTLPTAPRKQKEDMLDAIMCALVARSYALGNTELYGGHIIVPLEGAL